MDHERHFQPTSAVRSSPPDHVPQRSSFDYMQYPYPSPYTQGGSSYGFFPPSTPLGTSPSTFSAGPSNHFGTTTSTPPSAFQHASSSQNVYRPTMDFQYAEQSTQSQHVDEDENTQTQSPQQQRRGQRQRRRPTCGTGGHR